MRILHICQSADPAVGGAVVVARELAASQGILGHQSWVLYLYSSRYDGEDPLSHPESWFLSAKRSTRYGVGVWRLFRALRKIEPDVIHHHDGLLWPLLATGAVRAPLVTHGHLGAPDGESGKIVHRIASFLTQRLVAISPWVADSWVQSGFPAGKVRLISNGVNAARFCVKDVHARERIRRSVGIPPGNKVLLWVGRLEKETKGLDRLLAVVRGIEKDWTIVIAGDGPAAEWLDKQLMHISNAHVVKLGKVTDPETWFGVSDAFLFTSRVEPLGLVLLEAAASRLPIIAFPCVGGGAALLERPKAIRLEEAGPNNVSECVERIKPEDIEEAWQYVRTEHSWSSAALATLKVYEEVLGRG